jgi:dCMP deaminase
MVKGPFYQVIGLGYNGFPRGVEDLPERYAEKDIKYKMVVHGEANAIINANGSVRYCTIYATKFPCTDCIKLIIQSGIQKVVTRKPGGSEHWIKDSEYGIQMLKEAGIIVYFVEE